jgi:hypothetical protein
MPSAPTNVVPHRPANTVLAFQHIFTPSTINEAKFGVNRATYHNWSYGIAPVATSVSSASFSGLSSNSLDTEVGTTFSYIDNLTLVKGRHTLKFGGDVMPVRLNNSGNTLTTQSISYARRTISRRTRRHPPARRLRLLRLQDQRRQ